MSLQESTWAPGQHFYLRFLFLSPLDNHPFTIANIPDPPHKEDNPDLGLIRKAAFSACPHKGFTQKIAKFAQWNIDNNETAWFEGPHVGRSRDISRRCETLILIAGGSGVTACLSWLLHCTQVMVAGKGALGRVKLVWIVREKKQLEWIAEELKSAKTLTNGDDRLELIFYGIRSSGQLEDTNAIIHAEKWRKERKRRTWLCWIKNARLLLRLLLPVP